MKAALAKFQDGFEPSTAPAAGGGLDAARKVSKEVAPADTPAAPNAPSAPKESKGSDGLSQLVGDAQTERKDAAAGDTPIVPSVPMGPPPGRPGRHPLISGRL